jgi:SAV_6107-like HEPN
MNAGARLFGGLVEEPTKEEGALMMNLQRADDAESDQMPSALRLLESARQRLRAGESEASADGRYAAARLAVLRAAAAVLAARPNLDIPRRRKRPQDVWEQLPAAEPSLAQWAAHFSAAVRPRPSWFGQRRLVSPKQADDLLSDAQAFVRLAQGVLGPTSAQSAHPSSHRTPHEPKPSPSRAFGAGVRRRLGA